MLRGTLAAVQIRIGQGLDIHAFADDPSRPLVLAGVVIEGARGLAGHSDADAVIHACIDALLGAAGLGDIGMLYPDTDPGFAGADSSELLADTMQRVTGAGWQVQNIDCTVVAEAPRLAPHRAAMQDNLARLVGAPVSVKATRAEGLGALGRVEGIMCTAVALISRDVEHDDQEN
jgi:2-C-methyl-D-erythritol 2,4-cyclodiphosphate synthase